MSILTGKVAVITGGTSGIGKATAELFAREGARVIVTGRSGVDLAADAIGHGALGMAGDVADLNHHKAVAEFVKSRFGALDIYMANAGVINLSPSQSRRRACRSRTTTGTSPSTREACSSACRRSCR
jgi:NAD(P)-dependent dehydrogenase (short-subunit alcohol dehydrogenase family)